MYYISIRLAVLKVVRQYTNEKKVIKKLLGRCIFFFVHRFDSCLCCSLKQW